MRGPRVLRASFASKAGPVRNPWDLDRITGASSSRSAALVAAGEVDPHHRRRPGLIRIPSLFCGCVGLKPTCGLIPFPGAFPIEPRRRRPRDPAVHPRCRLLGSNLLVERRRGVPAHRAAFIVLIGFNAYAFPAARLGNYPFEGQPGLTGSVGLWPLGSFLTVIGMVALISPNINARLVEAARSRCRPRPAGSTRASSSSLWLPRCGEAGPGPALPVGMCAP